MVVAASASVLDGVGSMKLAISQEGLRSLLSQVEAELHRSDVYQSALANLQHEGTDVLSGSQALKTVGREAIRLALRYLAKHHVSNTPVSNTPISSTSASMHSTAHTGGSTSTLTSRSVGLPAKSEPTSLLENNDDRSAVEYPNGKPSGAALVAPAAPARLARIEPRVVSLAARQTRPGTRGDVAPSPAEQKRAALLRQIGMELSQARQERGISLERLHTQTWIPMHLIRALEVGDIDRLPEDIYIRGFVRRIADALGLEGAKMASSLVVLDQPQTVVPSWQQRSPEPPTLRPVHLYLSYAALMAGALGGLAWSYQSDAPQLVNPVLPDLQPEAAQSPVPSPVPSVGASSGPATTQTEGAIANPEVTPPETSRSEAGRP